jgi:hypothetical protein
VTNSIKVDEKCQHQRFDAEGKGSLIALRGGETQQNPKLPKSEVSDSELRSKTILEITLNTTDRASPEAKKNNTQKKRSTQLFEYREDESFSSTTDRRK